MFTEVKCQGHFAKRKEFRSPFNRLSKSSLYQEMSYYVNFKWIGITMWYDSLYFLDPIFLGPQDSSQAWPHWRQCKMAESGSLDFDLLWYLEKLNKREFQSLKNHLGQACVEIGLPPIPRLDLRKTRPDLVDLLTVSYEVQHIWNIMYSIFHKINRDNLCEKINARWSHE